MNSIEETIKIIERKIKEAEHYSDITGLCLTLDEELRNTLMNILSDYKKLQEEFNQVDHECDRLEKIDFEKDMKIKELQKENEKLKEFRRKFVDITDKELQEANEYFCTRYTFMGDELSLHINTLLKATNNSIPIQKVKDKIEELNRKIDKSIDNSKGGLDEEFIEKAGELLTQKRILQKLLESEE